MKNIKKGQKVIIHKEFTTHSRNISAAYSGHSFKNEIGETLYHLTVTDESLKHSTPSFDSPACHLSPVLDEEQKDSLFDVLHSLNVLSDRVNGFSRKVDLSCLQCTTFSDLLEAFEYEVGEYHYKGKSENI